MALPTPESETTPTAPTQRTAQTGGALPLPSATTPLPAAPVPPPGA